MKGLTRTGLVVAVLATLVAAIAWFSLFGASIGAVSSIESNSMSHAEEDREGVLDPGEWRRLDPIEAREDVLTFYEARAGDHRVGGDHGDVIAYRPEGAQATSPTPRLLPWPGDGPLTIEHRAIAWVTYNATVDAYDVPELGIESSRNLTLPDVGRYDPRRAAYVHEDLTVRLDPAKAGRHDGFLTKGDHNPTVDQDEAIRLGEAGSVGLVPVERVEGKVADHVDSDTILALQLGVPLAAAVLAGGVYAARRGHLEPLVPDRDDEEACPGCGHPLEDEEADFCPRCGQAPGDVS